MTVDPEPPSRTEDDPPAPPAAAPPLSDEELLVVETEEIIDAEREGDRPFAPGTARAALSYSGFRRVYTGWLASNVGSWMQNVVLTQWAYYLTKSPTFVSIVIFAQLGPLLLFSLIGGSLADRFDRRVLMIGASLEQLAFALALAWIGTSPDPSRLGIIACVFAIGMGQALAGPTFSSVLPNLVERRDIPGAVSLTSANMNLSRVIGAAIGPFVFARLGVSWVFAINGLTYLFIVAGIWTVRVPRVVVDPNAPSGWRRVLQGFSVARHDLVVRRVLVTCTVFSFFCLIFIGQMPTLAVDNLGIGETSPTYGWLYATFGFGALLGALSIGTVFAGRELTRLVRVGLIGFSILLAVFALQRSASTAFPVIALLGFFYFLVITGLSTVLQQQVDDRTRGRVMALWIMAFGGTVPIGNLVFGPIVEATSITAVMLVGVVVAVGLVLYFRIDAADADAVEPAVA
ncbi:MAG: MFS transporter [Acidimicrobiales bacterium]